MALDRSACGSQSAESADENSVAPRFQPDTVTAKPLWARSPPEFILEILNIYSGAESLDSPIDSWSAESVTSRKVQKRALEQLLFQPDGILDVRTVCQAGAYSRLAPVISDADRLAPPYRPGYSGMLSKVHQEYPETRLYIFRDAIVTGQGTLITRHGSMVEESCWELFANRVQPIGLQEQASGDFSLTKGIQRRVESPSLLLKRPWWQNYGHWLVDAASLLALLVESGRLGQSTIIIGNQKSPVMRRIVYETLAVLAPNNPVLEHPDEEMWQFSNLIYVAPVHVSGKYKLPASIEALRKRIPAAQRVSTDGKRFFLARAPSRRRRLENEDEIFGVCREFGFVYFSPEHYPLSEQRRIFAEAEAFVGVKGAAFTNLVFANPPAFALLLSPDDWPDLFFWDITSQIGVDYGELFGPVADPGIGQGQNPFHIDPDAFRNALSKMLATQSTKTRLERAACVQGPALKPAVPSEIPDHKGAFYQECLKFIHGILQPKAYLEIGTQAGDTLRLSSCPSVAIDIEFGFKHMPPENVSELHLFRMSSDEFFRRFDASAILGNPIDLAFLNGMHLFEFLLRDFARVEKSCSESSTIILHNCAPVDFYMTRRIQFDDKLQALSRHPSWWTGDVWKVVSILQHYRPGLEIGIFDAPPTGLAIMRNLDPRSGVLIKQYDEIVSRVNGWPSEQFAFSAYVQQMSLRPTSEIKAFLQETPR